MKKRLHARKKITLSRETLRRLENSALRGLAGGTSDDSECSQCLSFCHSDCGTCQIDSCVRCVDSLSCAIC